MIKIGKYFREISVVIIGVAVTLSASHWISEKNEKKNMKLYLNTMKTELELNAKNFDYYAKWLQKSVRYAEYLKANDKKNLNRDSLRYYSYTDIDGCGYMNFSPWSIHSFITNAFEMFKISSVMSQLSDKELLMHIWNAYTYLEYTRQRIDNNFRMKEDEVMKELELIADGKPVDVPMRIYYSSDMIYLLVRTCETASLKINKTLSELEKSKLIN